MNKYTRNFLVWGLITAVYFIAMVEVIYQGYAGWIAILMFVPCVVSFAFTVINMTRADLFIWVDDKEEYK